MAQWISAHNVFNATFWDYGSSLLSARLQPAQPRRLRGRLRCRTGRHPDRPAAVNHEHDASPDHDLDHEWDLWHTDDHDDDSADDGDDDDGPTEQDMEHAGRRRRRLVIDLGHLVTPVGRLGLPGHEQSRLVGVDPTRIGPLVSSRGAQFSPSSRPPIRGAVHRTGTVTWDITGRSDASVPCHWANNVTSSTTALTSCTVAPGLMRCRRRSVHRLRALPRGYGVTPSSATLTQTVAKASSQVWVRVNPAAPPAEARGHGDRARLSRERRDAHGHRDLRRLGTIGGAAAVRRRERGGAHLGHGDVCRATIGGTGRADVVTATYSGDAVSAGARRASGASRPADRAAP